MVKTQKSILELISKPKVGNDKSEIIEIIDDFLCPICQFDLTKFKIEARSIHINRCIDPSIPKSKGLSPKKRKLESNKFGNELIENDIKIIIKNEEIKEEVKEEIKKEKIIVKKRKVRIKPEIPFEKILKFDENENIIATDAFCYSKNEKIKNYLLTHFHSDHYGGLCKSWDNGDLIICTLITANLIIEKFNFPKDKLFIISEYNKIFRIPNTKIEIIAFDANHCPGAGIFILRMGNIKYLHCGDFRANNQMIKEMNNFEIDLKFNKCYLDTTYLNPIYFFPNQSDVVKFTSLWIKNKSLSHKTKQKRIIDFFNNNNSNNGLKEFLIIIGTYSVGKEKLAIGISKELNTKIYCSKEKFKLLKQYNWDELNDRIDINNDFDCGIHLLPMQKTKKEFLTKYFKKYSSKYKSILVIIPTGWTFGYDKMNNQDITNDSKLIEEYLNNLFERGFKVNGSKGGLVTIRKIQVPYSEHSSYAELVEFIQNINVEEWVPTVNMKNYKEQLELIEKIEHQKS